MDRHLRWGLVHAESEEIVRGTYMMLSMPCLRSLSRSSSLEVETPRRGELGRWLVDPAVSRSQHQMLDKESTIRSQ